jgi:hypothetical protein
VHSCMNDDVRGWLEVSESNDRFCGIETIVEKLWNLNNSNFLITSPFQLRVNLVFVEWKKLQPVSGIEPKVYPLPGRCSNHWAIRSGYAWQISTHLNHITLVTIRSIYTIKLKHQIHCLIDDSKYPYYDCQCQIFKIQDESIRQWIWFCNLMTDGSDDYPRWCVSGISWPDSPTKFP